MSNDLVAPLAPIVGIDLGTSNSALAVFSPGSDGPTVLEIPQLEGPGFVARHKTLPSSLYVPHTGELAPSDTKLPWGEGPEGAVVGVYARERGAQVPERLVSSAKSWLCNNNIDRYEAVLPWRSEIEAGKRSPMEASRLYLEHLKGAFEHAMRAEGQGVDIAHTDVVLTVPASFDEVARNLTHEAALAAGLARVTLLEEPLAALYAWIAASGGGWREHVSTGDLVLVCDVGGGTTDFSLVVVAADAGELRLERISVGEHLLLGGDNMDLALAYTLKTQLEAEGRSIDHWQFLSLVAGARMAKERILGDDSPLAVPVSIASRGSSLFAHTIATELTRDTVHRVLLDGFLPLTAVDQMPAAKRMSGIQEFGLPYESDAGISRHLARFLRRSRQNVASNEDLERLVAGRLSRDGKSLMPTTVLFNGGVFKSEALRGRVHELLANWTGGETVRELRGAHLDLAVAHGAAYYGAVRASGKGIRIQSGLARSYYVGLESSMPAVPGIEPPVKGLCLAPQGTEEGTELELAGRQFGLVVGEPVEFRFFSSTVRAGDGIGTVVDDATRDLVETARVSVTLPAADGREGQIVPVHLDAVVTEVGTLQLFMKDVASARKWNLEFNVRPHEHV